MKKKKQPTDPVIIVKDGVKYRVVPERPLKWLCHWSPCPQYEPNVFECPNCGGETNEWPEQWSNCPFCGEPIEMPK